MKFLSNPFRIGGSLHHGTPFYSLRNLYSSIGTAESQFDAPGSFESIAAWSLARERDC